MEWMQYLWPSTSTSFPLSFLPSTSKSTLCTQLAAHYGTEWVPEFAREYLLENGMNYTYDDLLTIAKGQAALEDEYVNKVSRQKSSKPFPIFIDTNMFVMEVWCEFVFGKCHDWILEESARRKYDLYLLCNIDLPWVKDELREYPDLLSRQKLFNIYKNIMVNQDIPWILIEGDYEQRVVTAVKATDQLLASP